MKLVEACLGWLSSSERRTAERQGPPYLVAHYWDGGVPKPHGVRDISPTGIYLLTEERWYPGTVVTLSLQRVGVAEADPNRSITVIARVVRTATDGVGLDFILPENHGNAGAHDSGRTGADRKSFQKFLHMVPMVQADQSKANSDEANSGQALLEFVFMLPILLVLIMNVVNFGGLFYAWITVANAARAGVNYAVLGVASAGSLSQASVSSINSMLTTEVSSLPNQASLVVNICKTYNGITTTLSGTCTSIPADPEATSFTLESIDVTYTYVPFINPTAFQFPNLNLYVTIPPTTLHNRAVMRVIN